MFRIKIFSGLLALMLFTSLDIHSQGIILYTPYTKISVPPGESVDYSIEIHNNSASLKNVPIVIQGMPKGWTYELKSGGWKIGQIAVMPRESKTVSLKVEIPFVVNKGIYRFNVSAPGYSNLPLIIEITKEGTSRSELSTNLPSMEGHSGSTFTFNADLRNRSGDKQLYVLSYDAPKGWEVVFKDNGKQVNSINVESGNTEKLTIEVNPPDNIPAGKYKIPIYANTSSNSASIDLEVTITGSYGMELTTPNGRLSTNITAGGEKKLELWVKNTGSSPLTDIQLDYNAPANWLVTFNPQKITKIDPGKYALVIANIKADRKAIPGDYVTNIEAKTQEVTSKAAFRISVKTPMVYGWIGIAIILLAIYVIYYLFKKYGRR
jgi:uncharacterized membrane protein